MILAAKFPPNEYICDGKILKLISHGIFEPPSHDILNPIPMVYQTPYARYIEPPTYDISKPLYKKNGKDKVASMRTEKLND